jgi:hypothetical protein
MTLSVPHTPAHASADRHATGASPQAAVSSTVSDGGSDGRPARADRPIGELLGINRTEAVALVSSWIAAAGFGALGFGFGYRVGGGLVGTMSALCAAAMAAILVASAVERLGAWWPRQR